VETLTIVVIEDEDSHLTISEIFSLWYGGNSLLGNSLRKNEAVPLWTKLIMSVINNLLIISIYYTKRQISGRLFSNLLD